VEQRIGSNSQPLDVPVVPAAAVDPAYIPGLTSPAPAEPENTVEKTEAEETEAEETEAQETEAEEKGAEAEASAGEEASAEEEASDEDQASAEEEASDDDAPVSDAPVFEASDRRASITADRSGVRLRLDDQEAEFRWDEIGAVETESPRFGKRFTITVHTPDRRWYPIEIEATARARFKEWETRLDEVLDAYFQE
jgi:hypothetical protein